MTSPNLVECPQCHEPKLQHRVCKECGHYNGRVVLEQKDEVVED